MLQVKRTRSITAASSKETISKRRKTIEQVQRKGKEETLPRVQSALKLHAIRQPYEVSADHPLPSIQHDSELLVKVQAVGLNPIDWKAPDYNFGIPTLPYISGREYSGTALITPTTPSSRIKKGDRVLVPSTDYRDPRKAAYQHYSIASTFNTIRLPPNLSLNSGSILGVAFVSAALTLGICLGLDFSDIEDGPDILGIVRSLDPDSIPGDIRQECFHSIGVKERIKAGDNLVIWGAGSVCAFVTMQIARLAGIKVVAVVDAVKHGSRLLASEAARPDYLVDAHDPGRAVEVIRAYTGKTGARFGFDTLGRETAGHLMSALAHPTVPPSSQAKLPTPPSTPHTPVSTAQRSHLVGLTGLPKDDVPKDVALHSVPIKLYHEVPQVGEALSAWCERLLAKGMLVPPDVVGTVDGLEGVNAGLDRMRRREVSGGRLVAVLK
ncbi:uncharacterized protein J4E78_000378 [Alternaria triticimaculans]|uniref:uncharacterized protein n=1 Tax=Alternaria triticimaculans TaxID=297637 RepID=UPI0020C58A9E|nr:uncharacterized protein J4E78_000378 [Alternaria triticimaculans]KAI4671880.1 hypothetical protein J4E78_000378 [Alternaria triticimaculans]